MINRIHGGNIQQYSKDSKIKLTDFSANINPLGLPFKAKETILKNISNILHYPDPASQILKKELSKLHNIKPNNILAGNGSIELIHLIPRALNIKSALIATPTFSEYEFALKANKARILFANALEKNDFKLDISEIEKLIPKVNLFFLCNPNNPTGTIMPKDEIISILELCKKHKTFLVIDEVFMDFVDKKEELTLINEAIKNNQLLVLMSLTKFFSLAGLRLGYLIGQEQLIRKISHFQYPWNVNSLAQAVASEIIKDKTYINKSKNFISSEKKYLFENLKKIKGLKIYPPSSNFIFCKLESSIIQSSRALNKKLIRQGIIIRCCDNFRGLTEKFFRVAVRTRSENNRLIASLKEILINKGDRLLLKEMF